MERFNIYIGKSQRQFLENIHEISSTFDKLSISEHIRRAIDEYIEKLKQKIINVSQSPSENG